MNIAVEIPAAPVQRVCLKQVLLSECTVSWRTVTSEQTGAVFRRLEVIHDGHVMYSEYEGRHLKTAFEFLAQQGRQGPRKWLTVEILVCLRQAFREDTVNCNTDDMEELLSGPATHERVRAYLYLARARDHRHHGCNTF